MAGGNVKQHVDGVEESVDVNKRWTILGLWALATTVITWVAGRATDALAEEVQQDHIQEASFQTVSLDYSEMAEAPVDSMLLSGEKEWFTSQKVLDKYWDRVAKVWEKSIVSKVSSGKISNRTAKLLEQYTPNMLISFGRELSWNEKYKSLYAAGANFITKLNGQVLEKLT